MTTTIAMIVRSALSPYSQGSTKAVSSAHYLSGVTLQPETDAPYSQGSTKEVSSENSPHQHSARRGGEQPAPPAPARPRQRVATGATPVCGGSRPKPADPDAPRCARPPPRGKHRVRSARLGRPHGCGSHVPRLARHARTGRGCVEGSVRRRPPPSRTIRGRTAVSKAHRH
jgi:hypothetical protein